LCIPKNAKPKSLPVLVRYHGAGVRSAAPVTMYRGVITLDVNAHGIENGKAADFYSNLAKKELKDYRLSGKLDRNKGYFVGMYQRVMRSLDYVKTLPEWDGKTLVVYGGSQGGGQSLAAAALDKDVTHCVAGVPAICDHGGVLAGRVAGWPQFVSYSRLGKLTDEDKAVLREVAYVDGANMARRIKAVTYIGTGFIDTTCAPTSVFAAYNNIPAGVEKYMTISPDKGHNAPNTKGMDWISAMTKKSYKAEKK
jgi:cephalosporin-C deacetylase-like acetyl esterase